MSHSPKAFHTKSRNGCVRCKARKVKCDEKTPTCSRCEAKGLQCPGYALNVRWSKKHEMKASRLLSQQSIQGVSQQQSSADQATFGRSVEDRIGHHEAASWLNSHDQWAFDADVSDTAALLLGNEQEISPVPNWECSDLNGMAWTPVESSLPSPLSVPEQPSGPQSLQAELVPTQNNWPPQEQTIPLSPTLKDLSQAIDIRQRSPNRDIQELPRQIVHVSTALSEYFFSEIIPLYCVWDSKLNIMRNIVESTWQSSGALHHTIQSMAAACLSESFPHLLPVARQEHGRALAFIKNRSVEPAHKQAMALAATFLGHTSSWISPENLAPDMYQTSWNMLEEITSENGDSTSSFFSGTMDYWAMLLAYLTDSQQLNTSEKDCRQPPTTQERFIDPHPYCGISHGVIRVLRDTGILIFRYRKQLSKVSFMTEAHVDIFRYALRKARRLERILLAHRLPDLSQIRETGDPQTPLKHLELMDEAYRYTGLLQLYRVFPDLLIERYAPWNKENILQPALGTETPTDEERQIWLTELALHVINILEDIPFESHTRSAQPFIMVAVSSELALNSQQNPLDRGFESLDQLPFRVTKARKFLSSRLAAYTHILPLQKTRAISKLINHIWAALDAGEKQVYWLDVAYEKKMGTMFG